MLVLRLDAAVVGVWDRLGVPVVVVLVLRRLFGGGGGGVGGEIEKKKGEM